MSNVQAVPLTAGAADLDRSAVIRTIDAISASAGFVAAIALAVMTVIVGYEVVSRSMFNAPTTWVTEISTYIFVGIVFLGFAEAQRANAHIKVDLLVDRLSKQTRHFLELIGLWLGLLLIVASAWHMARFTFQEYVHDSRDWGLLGTPQWMPQLPITIGYMLFAAALLRDIFYLRPPAAALAQWSVPAIAIALIVGLFMLGRADLRIPGTRFDWGTIAICAAVTAAMFTWSGVRIALTTVALVVVLAVVFYFSRGTSQLWLGILLGGLLCILLFLGVGVAFVMGSVGMLGLYFLLPLPQLAILADRSWTSINTFTLTAVPSFVLLGSLLVRSGITSELFDALVRWFGRTPVGLAHSSVAAAASFAAVC